MGGKFALVHALTTSEARLTECVDQMGLSDHWVGGFYIAFRHDCSFLVVASILCWLYDNDEERCVWKSRAPCAG